MLLWGGDEEAPIAHPVFPKSLDPDDDLVSRLEEDRNLTS